MKYYIDLGSNVIKIYSAENDDTEEERIKLLEKHEFSFQENFEEDSGLKIQLFKIFRSRRNVLDITNLVFLKSHMLL